MFMLKNILQNIMQKPATRPYPTVKREPYERYRGRLIGNVQECIFCRLCSNKCPSQCISTDPKEAYWGYDPFSCVYCGLCVDICPTKCLSLMDTHREPVTSRFVVYHKGTPRVARQKLAKDEMALKNDSTIDIPTPEGMPAVGANPVPERVRITAKAQLKTQAARPKPKLAAEQKPVEQAAKPEVQAAKPEVQAAKPEVQAAKPEVQAEDTAQPNKRVADEQNLSTSKPVETPAASAVTQAPEQSVEAPAASAVTQAPEQSVESPEVTPTKQTEYAPSNKNNHKNKNKNKNRNK